MNPPKPSPPPLYPIHTDAEARALLHGAGATLGAEVLSLMVPTTTPLYDLIRAGVRLGYGLTLRLGGGCDVTLLHLLDIRHVGDGLDARDDLLRPNRRAAPP